jgi:hypothetical protein
VELYVAGLERDGRAPDAALVKNAALVKHAAF